MPGHVYPETRDSVGEEHVVSPPWRQLGQERQAEALYLMPTGLLRAGDVTLGPWATIVPMPGAWKKRVSPINSI